jgi:arabinofuranosyltransferase
VRSGLIAWIAGGAAIVAGLLGAIGRAWVCDDAFISFRYALNLVEGKGLVFNAGERVEGFTNLLWTLWSAAGMTLGVSPERWTIVWGLVCHAGILALLVAWHRRLRPAGSVLPVAALLASLHPDLAIWATSGLETSLFTFLVLLGVFVMSMERPRTLAAGAVLALASLTRPDGPIFVVLAAAYLGLRMRSGRQVVQLLVAFLAVWGPVTFWRVSYYGDFFPNTYHAKSADQSWYAQGLRYAWLYFQRYWVLLLGLVAGVALLARARRDRRAASDVLLLGGCAVGYSLYVIHVGGDFMFARLLIPATPFFLILLEAGLARTRWPVQAGAAAVCLAGVVLTPTSVGGKQWVHGIANEWDHYNRVTADWDAVRARGRTLRRYFEGLPVRMCFLGEEARLVYESRVAVAIECETGLTDRFIARQTLARRGRIGHEKKAPLPYIIDERKLNLVVQPYATAALGLDRWLPRVPVVFPGESEASTVRGRILTWDPAVMQGWRERGARFPDVPAQIDGYIRDELPKAPIEKVRHDHEQLRKLYFDHAGDPAREQPFLQRLNGPD